MSIWLISVAAILAATADKYFVILTYFLYKGRNVGLTEMFHFLARLGVNKKIIQNF